MKYNIIGIPDIHWGVISPELQKEYLSFIPVAIKEMYNEDIIIDCVIIMGDYWDCKLPMNSKESIYGIQWMAELINTCKECKVKYIRIFKGTRDHDNDELEVFRHYEKENGDWFKLYNETTSEEILPGMRVLFCPDENLTTDKYIETYLDTILNHNDIGFFHGSFDVVYMDKGTPQIQNNVVFEYDLFDKCLPGGMFAGHWHDGKKYNNLNYIGSPFRFKFDEDEPKGIGFIQYDTDTKSSYYKKILNPISPEYITFNLYTNVAINQSYYHELIKIVDNTIESSSNNPYKKTYIRIMIYVTDDKPENGINITSLRHYYSNNRDVKIVEKDKLKEKRKKELIKKNEATDEEYKFINNKSAEKAEVIKEFIFKTKGIDVPIEVIKKRIEKYRKQLDARKDSITDEV